MLHQPKQNSVLVLDLDDTLYKEADYVLSGINHIAELLKKITQQDIKERLLNFYYHNPQGDFLDLACQLTALPLASKESLLWAYRTHYPSISLEHETKQWLGQYKQEYYAIAILTDGRAITQRLKIAALGLCDIPAYISEEWDSVKPDYKRFIAIQERWPNKSYIYIGDNPKKDFIAPNALGWTTFCLKANKRNIHLQDISYDKNLYRPHFFVNHLPEIDFIQENIINETL